MSQPPDGSQTTDVPTGRELRLANAVIDFVRSADPVIHHLNDVIRVGGKEDNRSQDSAWRERAMDKNTVTTTIVLLLVCVFILSGCGLVMCNDENEMMFPCPIGPCWGRCSQ